MELPGGVWNYFFAVPGYSHNEIREADQIASVETNMLVLGDQCIVFDSF